MINQHNNSIADFSISPNITKPARSYLQVLLEIILKYVCFTENGKVVNIDGYRYIMDQNDITATIPLNGAAGDE